MEEKSKVLVKAFCKKYDIAINDDFLQELQDLWIASNKEVFDAVKKELISSIETSFDYGDNKWIL